MVKHTDIRQLKQLNRNTLCQLGEALGRMDAALYTSVSRNGNASVGQHVRHTLEFYGCLFRANEEVNYDVRERDVLMESSPQHARQEIDRILLELDKDMADRPLTLAMEVNEQNGSVPRFPSSLARELFYVLEHAIHHMALIRLLVKEQRPDFELDESFGVAYSTLTYMGQLANS